MLSTSTLLDGNVALVGGSQTSAHVPTGLAGLTLGAGSNPIQCITTWLNDRKNKHKTSDLHIIGHGNSDGISLSDQQIDCSTLLNESKSIREWDVERIYLWSCNLGNNTNFISILESLTGAEVFASRTIIDRGNTRVESNKGNTANLGQIISPKDIEAWKGNLATPANSHVTVHTGHIDSGPTDYFRYYGPGDGRNGAGVAILQSMPWWGDADLAEQWALNSHYTSPNLNIDGGTGGDEEQVAFAYDFYLWGAARNTRYLTQRKPDDYHNYAPDPDKDEVGQHWSGGYAVDFSTFSGITINQTGARNGTDLLTTEAGGSSTFTVVLDTAPTANVTVTITGLKTQEGSISTDTLTFTTANWDTPQTVTVTGVDDNYANGDYTYSLIAKASNSGGYAGTERAATNVKNVDDDTNGVTIAQTGTNDGSGNLLTTEAGGTSTFTVVLDAEPTANVTVSLTGNDATENSLSTDTLTFTTANWNTAQTVTVTGVNDSIVDGDITTTLTATASNTGGYAGSETDTSTVKNTDNETSGITIAQTGTNDGSGNLLTTEAGGTSTFTVVLDAEPTANVTVSLTGNDATENSLSTDTLTFTTANWNTPQTVTVTGVNDSIVDEDITTTLTATASNTGGYAGSETSTIKVKNTDNETSGITIAQTGTNDGSGNLLTTEAGGTSTFTVVLDAEPTANVTVSLTGNDATENSLSTDTLTFTTANWNTAQTVTVTGVNDSIVDGDITTTLTATASNAGGYAGTETSTIKVKNTDNETSGITIAQTGTNDGSGNLLTTEAGGTSTFTVVLDAEPTANVTVSLTGNDATENSLSTDTLTFTTANWNTAQTVTVTGVNDSIVDGDITTTLTATASNAGGYAGTETSTIKVKNTDNETSGITIAQTGTNDGSGNLLTTEAGGTSTFTVVLDAEPTANVTVSLTGNDATENSLSTDTLTFTTANWNTAQTVTVTGVNDSIVDGDITTTLTATASNAGGYAGTETSTIKVKNTDNETNGITIAQTGTNDGSGNLLTTETGGTSTFTVVLDAEPTANVTVSLTGNDATENSLSTDTLTFTTANWNTAQTVTITGVNDSIVDGDITTTLTATASNAGGYAGTETSTIKVKNTDVETVSRGGSSDGSSDGSSSGDSNTVKPTNTPKDEDGDNDGAIDSFERSIDPDTQKPLDRNNDGIADHNQRTVASFASTSGKVSSLSSQNPILNAAENTSQGSIQSKIALLFRGISAEAEQEAGSSIRNLQKSINIIGANTNSQRYQAAGKTVIKTSDQPDFRLIPELIVEGNVPQDVINTHQSAANERFTNTIHRIDYRFEEGDNNWNALFKPDESGRLRLLGYDPITGLGGILTDRDGDGRADGATIFLKDNQKGDLNPDPFVIDDPVGAAELQSPPQLIATADGKGLVVEGPEGLGLWVRLKTTTAHADWQNGLQLISSNRKKIGGIGATRENTNLGCTEIYLQSGEELHFQQSSNNNPNQISPSITIKQNAVNESWNLCLDDGGRSPDGDYDDLEIIIDSHITPHRLDSVLMASQQNALADGILDLRDLDRDTINLELSIKSNANHKNRLAFVLLDGRDNDQELSINGIESTNSKAFEAEVADSLINPGGDQLYLQGKTDKTAKWTLNNDQFGLYAPVIITEDNELFTAGLSSRDGHSHLKLIGQNHFAFEDMTHSNNSDFDYNDVVIKVDTT